MISPSNIAETLIKNHPRIVLFDGVCNLCSGWVQFVHVRDPELRFRFASVQSPEGQAILQYFGLPTDDHDTMVYIENGLAFYRSTAFLQVIRQFPFPWFLLGAGRVMPVPVRDWAYDRVAQNRYRLMGKKDQCLVPDADLMRRFLAAGV